MKLANRYSWKIRINAIMPDFFLTEQSRTLLTNTDGSLADRGNKVVTNIAVQPYRKSEKLSVVLV